MNMRTGHWGQARRQTVLVMTLLVTSVALMACGGAKSGDRKSAPSAEEREKRSLEAQVGRELRRRNDASGPTLARVGLPGGDAVSMLAIRCAMGTGCYELVEGWEEPAVRDDRHGIVRRIVASGEPVSNVGPAERVVLNLSVNHGCAGARGHEYPFAFAHGLLRGVTDIVTTQAGSKTIRLKKAVIPARMHPEGVLVYGLLLPGPNDVVVRTPGGRIVSASHWSGPGEEVSCHNG